MNPYVENLRATLPGVVEVLSRKGIHGDRLAFGGEGVPPAKKVTVPTDARSEFLANRAMGDWAENTLSILLRNSFPNWRVEQYGNTDRIAAGHPEFKARYLAGVEETRRFGKRPDLLIFSSDSDVPTELADMPFEQSAPSVQCALASVEVRSSKFEALTYMRVRKEQKAAGNTAVRETPSFTVKVEDLIIVYRWLERFGVPQSYCQVFFDSIFAINFLRIFTIIGSGTGFTIETPAKSQEKATIMIPITSGTQIGTGSVLPHFEAEHRVTALGRHDAFVVPRGGSFSLDAAATQTVFFPS